MKKFFLIVFLFFMSFIFVLPAMAAPDNYLTSTKLNQRYYIRWDNNEPIRVYIDKSQVSLQWSDEVRKAFEKWRDALSGVMDIEFVSDAHDAHIVCTFEQVNKKPNMEMTLGYTRIIWERKDLQNRLGKMEIKIGTKKNSGSEYTHIAVYNTALHEAGHALGIWGHSPYYGDIMYPAIRPLSHTTRQVLTARDKKTIRMLYSTQADITHTHSNI